jgi:hypothetical protein
MDIVNTYVYVANITAANQVCWARRHIDAHSI